MSLNRQLYGGELLKELNESALEARFVDKARFELLSKLGISSIQDLLLHIPFRYLDLRLKNDIRSAPPGEGAFIGTVRDIVVKRPRPRLNVTEVSIVDGSGTLVLVWFNQPWISRSLSLGDKILAAGQVNLDYGLKKITNPFFEKVDDLAHMKSIVPVYSTTEGLSQGWLRKIIAAALNDYGRVADILPFELRAARKLPSFSWALQQIHYPEDFEKQKLALSRLAYEELFIFELAIAERKSADAKKNPGRAHKLDGKFFKAYEASLSFELSDEQKQVIDEIKQDMASESPMRRILIGDVGTGKTVVALHALCIACDSGHQAALMAPTEVLADQYAKKAIPALERIGIKSAMLTGASTTAERREIRAGLESGEISVLIGTHALLEPEIIFKDLSLVVIDEQHRFGVKQRAALSAKGAGADLLTMTATPIPRSLAQTAFGDMEASYIRNRPVSGAGFDTKVLKFHQIFQAHDSVKQAVARGEQAYVVTALIDESDALEAQAAIKVAEDLSNNEYSHLRVGLLTGRMRSAEKTELMTAFEAGELDVLVSTTVIEVGLDVPNATQMIILNAERFGVAQLHQLRGRVGRGSKKGNVFLVSDSFSKEAKDRFNILAETDDGFRLAEFDLSVRGAGELLGTKQSGIISFKIADIVRDADLVRLSRYDAKEQQKRLDEPELALLKIKISEKLETFELMAQN